MAADWLLLAAAPILAGSLFLTWSHQLSPALRAQYGATALLRGVPADPDAWQVYSIADVLLLLLALSLLAVALRGGRSARRALALALLVALSFTIHALGVPPTNGALVFDATTGGYVANPVGAGAGEVVALIALVFGLVAVALSFDTD